MTTYLTVKLTEREARIVAGALEAWADPEDGRAYRDAQRVAAKVRAALGARLTHTNAT